MEPSASGNAAVGRSVWTRSGLEITTSMIIHESAVHVQAYNIYKCARVGYAGDSVFFVDWTCMGGIPCVNVSLNYGIACMCGQIYAEAICIHSMCVALTV